MREIPSSVKIDVPAEVMPLIPGFFKRRLEDIVALQEHLRSENYDEIMQIGHRLKGNGAAFGFKILSELGAEIEFAGKGKDRDILFYLINDFEDVVRKLADQF